MLSPPARHFPSRERFVVQELGALLPFVAIALLFWLLIIRPASRRQKAMVQMQSAVSVGDEIILTSGVYGQVAEMEDSVLHLTIADGITIKVARGAVGTVVRPEEEPTEADSPVVEEHPADRTDPDEPKEI
jgi:preprotein translocase subunit YajC